MPSNSDTPQLKKLMRILETQQGTLTKHRPMTEGIHKGTTAIGDYGMMPLTIDEFAERGLKAQKNDLDAFMKTRSPYEKEVILKENPDIEEAYATRMANHILEKQGGDIDRSAAAWLYGHNMSQDKAEKKLENDPEYQRRIDKAIEQEHLQSTKPLPAIIQKILNSPIEMRRLQSIMGVSKPLESEILNKDVKKKKVQNKEEAPSVPVIRSPLG